MLREVNSKVFARENMASAYEPVLSRYRPPCEVINHNHSSSGLRHTAVCALLLRSIKRMAYSAPNTPLLLLSSH